MVGLPERERETEREQRAAGAALGALVPSFTSAFVGSWAPGHPWAELARSVVVRVPT